MNCIFCEILYGNEPHTTAFDGIATLGIVPLNPVVEGHLIFMPRKHVRHFDEHPGLSATLMDDVASYAKSRRFSVLQEDYNIIVNTGAEATQTVNHLHAHYVPRRSGDGLHLPWTGQEAS